MTYDFSGWASKSNVRCTDGRIILNNAFADNDNDKVPLVWNHDHQDPSRVLGHAMLKNVPNQGVYAYCSFNDTNDGQRGKALVQHGDITSLSIYANQLQENDGCVRHGNIREVSLVLAGANPGAKIDDVIMHSDGMDSEAIIYSGVEGIELSHADDNENNKPETKPDNNSNNPDSDNRTVEDVIKTFNDEQLKVFYALIGLAMSGELNDDKNDKKTDTENNKKDNEDKINHSEGDNESMKNLFEKNSNPETNNTNDELIHTALNTIINDAQSMGSLKKSYIQHADEYGISNIDYLFPDAKNVTTTPELIKRDTDWVNQVMSSVSHSPFSRIKSVFADITADEARAKGYVKGNLKMEEVITTLRRVTTPVTIYKKQKLDRDDIIDITDFDVVSFIKSEMRTMLDEEIARAILVGDGRLPDDSNHINDQNLRAIYKDHDLYTIKARVNVAKAATSDEVAKEFIRTIIKTRKDYKGSGNPVLYTTEDYVTDCLLMEDKNGRVIYDSVDKLATALRVSKIVTVPVMENMNGATGKPLMGIIVNLKDYKVGADKGGSINMFEDFDIDYNQNKYLIETRISGALVKPHSAIALELYRAEN